MSKCKVSPPEVKDYSSGYIIVCWREEYCQQTRRNVKHFWSDRREWERFEDRDELRVKTYITRESAEEDLGKVTPLPPFERRKTRGDDYTHPATGE